MNYAKGRISASNCEQYNCGFSQTSSNYQIMSDTKSQPHQPLENPSSEPDPKPLDAEVDEPISEISEQAEAVGSPVEDDDTQAADLDEL
jgi:hypothetical protein